MTPAPSPPAWLKLLVWLGSAVACWVVVIGAVLLALGGCAPGTAGEVCNEPDAADCDSHTGGEAGP